MVGWPQQVSTNAEQVEDDTLDRDEALSLACRFEPPHLSLPLPSRLMRNLRSIVRVAPRVVDNGRHHGAMRSTVAPELVGDQAPRCAPLAFQ